jgi:hypothetical protein
VAGAARIASGDQVAEPCVVASFQAARSDEGYTVRLRGLKRGVEYREGDHVVRIAVETAAVEVDWIICLQSIGGWLPPHQQELLGDERRGQIQERVVSALDVLAIKYRLAE